MNFRKRSLRVATVVVGGAAVAGVAWIALPANAAANGIVSIVDSNVVNYKAAPGTSSVVTITRTGNTVIVDDGPGIDPGAGCVWVYGDKTQVSCTPKVPVNWIRVDLGDRNDIVVNRTDLGMTARTGSGNDRITGGPKRDDVYAGDGDDVIQSNGGNDVLRGDAGNDLVIGGDGDDTLSGSTGNDTLNGGAGNDGTSYGGPGDDVIYGGDGNDKNFNGGPGNDKIYGGEGNDTLYGDEDNDIVDGGNGEGWLWGGEGDDQLTGGSADDYILGDQGNDRVAGGNGRNIMHGGPGNDTLTGGTGVDHFAGGYGNDVMNGGSGENYFDEGTDVPAGTADADTFIGGPNIDVLIYDLRTTNITADADGVQGDDGAPGEGDTIDPSISHIWAGSGNDRLTGTAGADTLKGGPGDDTIAAGAGDDALWGEAGTDNLDGGAGDDFCADPIAAGETVVNCEYGSGAPALRSSKATSVRADQLKEMERLEREVKAARR
ncbi:calcium-binding protein [Actinoplanes sp. Pm04-4]|uniref:Calcium-binding protein n=1 Tax=Paractinoplanes pyxinae TaxID=2997416 RepID=A0ABT4B7S3_9ACTN|nr:calcium-binding protein [Actinoplanes pyxinae]MCY1142516.1 calcium-binding protein [Actinoplanes pyxinae]